VDEVVTVIGQWSTGWDLTFHLGQAHRIGAVAHNDKKLTQARIAQSFHDMLQNRPATAAGCAKTRRCG
jgi:hypothetical protein